MRRLALLLILSMLALPSVAAAGEGSAERSPASPRSGVGILVGASRQNVAPFTIVPGATNQVSPLSDRRASNPDGLPGGLWDTMEPEPGFTSEGQITPTGIWGEAYEDANANGRYDTGESFTDDLVNTRLDPDSAQKYDGIYLAGFGNDRIARGAFDPVWARAVYVRDAATGLSYAQVSVDFIGRFSDFDQRILDAARAQAPGVDLDHLIVATTHNHEAPDVIGLWGRDLTFDGTYPKYERYLELKIAQAVADAAKAAAPAVVRYGSMFPGMKFRTPRGNVERLDGMQTRNSCRTPWVFDDELRVAQFARPNGGGTIATIVNWGTHVESLEDRNTHVSSDYVHTVRQSVEAAFGGVAIHLNGAQGAVEIIGDSCLRRWQRDTYDGERFPVAEDGEPLVFERMDRDATGPRRRTYAIGRVVGGAAIAAIRKAKFQRPAGIEGFTERELFVPVNNQGLAALSVAGVIDKPAYIGGVGVANDALREAGVFRGGAGLDGRTVLYAWKIGGASFVTAPGELAPELFWGLAGHHRGLDPHRPTKRKHFDYVRPNPAAIACARRAFSYDGERGADTGRPFEPGVRLAAARKFKTPHVFLIGYAPDLLGYIVPGYDFAWFAAPPLHGVGLGALHGTIGPDEAPDPCADHAPDLAFPDAHYRSHYQETNSAGSIFAAAYACTVWDMLGLDPGTSPEGGEACAEWEDWLTAGIVHLGVENPPLCDQTSETDCVRHY